ncbi:hypothetical protein HY632_01660 [Candidatus Uhrbacteria bacterium]|nr:hypothetical protein [Candidatus Uhrbacteria bacterium]
MLVKSAYDAHGYIENIEGSFRHTAIPYGRVKVVCWSLVACLIAATPPFVWHIGDSVIGYLPFPIAAGIGVVFGIVFLSRIAGRAEAIENPTPLGYLAAVYRRNHIGYEVTAWSALAQNINRYTYPEYCGVVHPERFRAKAIQERTTPGRCSVTIALGGRHTRSHLTYNGVPIPGWSLTRDPNRDHCIDALLCTDTQECSVPIDAERLLREFDDYIAWHRKAHGDRPGDPPSFPRDWGSFFAHIADCRERAERDRERIPGLEQRIRELEVQVPQRPGARAS